MRRAQKTKPIPLPLKLTPRQERILAIVDNTPGLMWSEIHLLLVNIHEWGHTALTEMVEEIDNDRHLTQAAIKALVEMARLDRLHVGGAARYYPVEQRQGRAA